jgi:hypothetical protein
MIAVHPAGAAERNASVLVAIGRDASVTFSTVARFAPIGNCRSLV